MHVGNQPLLLSSHGEIYAGHYFTHGMIDLHVNGSGEADVGEANLTAMETISRSLAAHGTTGFPGHSEADRALLHPERRHRAGANFNATSTLHHPNPDTIDVTLESRGISAAVIADGNHVHGKALGSIQRTGKARNGNGYY